MKEKTSRSRLVSIFLSALVPGLGQLIQKKYRAAIAIFLAVATSIAVVAWYGKPAWYILPALIWLWNI